MQFQAKNYLNRQDLEEAIKAEVGDDSKANKEAGHNLIGTREQLKRLHLTDTTTVYGVFCIISDFSTKDKLKTKLDESNKAKSGGVSTKPEKATSNIK